MSNVTNSNVWKTLVTQNTFYHTKIFDTKLTLMDMTKWGEDSENSEK